MAFNKDYILAAYNNMPMPDALKGAGALCYMALAAMYGDYRRGEVSKTDAAKSKKLILANYELAEFDCALNKRHVDTIKATEFAINTYRTSRTLENADKLVEAFQGVKVIKEET